MFLQITEDDIRKSHGGGSHRNYYSSAYASSTNAYMLMYRQIDKDRNAKAMTPNEFPTHINNLLNQMREKEEKDRLYREKENDMFKLKVHCFHPGRGLMVDCKLYFCVDSLLSEAVSEAYQRLKLNDACEVEDCRLVTYNKMQDCIDCSFEGENLRFCDITGKIRDFTHTDWLLEIRQPGMYI